MANKIKVNASVSDESKHFEFSFDDLDITKDEWRMLSSKEQTELIQKALNELPEQPYWFPDSFQG